MVQRVLCARQSHPDEYPRGLLTCISRYFLFYLSLSEILRACHADAFTFPPIHGFKSGVRPVISRALGGGTRLGLMTTAKLRELQCERFFFKEKEKKRGEGLRVVGTRTCFAVEFEVWRRNLDASFVETGRSPSCLA